MTTTKVYPFETVEEQRARIEYEDALISAYVPESDTMTREEALALANERDLQAAMALRDDVITLENLQIAISRSRT
ncbi:hypothetical protein ADN00_18810 [Ornatilinea apprima]|uniref:Uncharacterized protein n=1 Tax=Ornatilinea apprima TaxID=1134406 RepID=A0A0P6WVX2_9CHLR|nr:hypothetical protein [Ornatilinea apprima]KPL70096.1 hypothetical protein ADN00_18810 [Ornatilinea apprima]